MRLRVIGADGYNGKDVALAEFRIFGVANAETNLALNRPVTCSSEQDAQQQCANAVDGRNDTFWTANVPADFTVESPNWWWVDALYGAAPIYATLNKLEKQGMIPAKPEIASLLYAKFDQAKVQNGLFNADAGLWYRDARFHTIRSPNDKDI